MLEKLATTAAALPELVQRECIVGVLQLARHADAGVAVHVAGLFAILSGASAAARAELVASGVVAHLIRLVDAGLPLVQDGDDKSELNAAPAAVSRESGAAADAAGAHAPDLPRQAANSAAVALQRLA